MEDVLSVYARPYDENFPVICMDEKPVQLFANARKSRRSKDGRIEYEDNEYIRNGTAAIFLFSEPLNGWRFADAQEHRTREDWAKQIKWLLDEQYPNATKVVLVMDNLNTHNTASLYQTFPPEEAFRLASRLEIHYTPKHGSWLDMAEIELSALGRQCIGSNRIPDLETLRNLIKVEEGAVPPYITNEGKIYCRLSSGSFPIKDATHMARLIEKRRDTMHMISDKIDLNPIEIGRETPTNLCAYIDVGIATTLTASTDSQYERFDHLNYEIIASILKKFSSNFGISRIGSSLVFTLGNMTGKRDDGTTQILGAGIQFFMELMIDGSVKYRIPLSYDVDSKKNSCNITGISTIVSAFTDIYEHIFGKDFAELFVYAYKYQRLTVLKQFRPYYYLGEQNDPEIVKKIRTVETLHQEKYGDNLIVEGNRIPPDKYGLIDRHLFNKFKIPYNSHELIAVLFSNAYGNLGFIENPFVDNDEEQVEREE